MTTLQEIEKRFDEMALSIGMANTHGAMMSKHFYRTEIQALLEGLVKKIESKVVKMMETDNFDRYESREDIVDALHRSLGIPPSKKSNKKSKR
jgi:hypothetical protein